jgi:Staphylococcal nuclease homologue
MRGQRIRLFGIDSPGKCSTLPSESDDVSCGQQKTALALADRIGERTVRCRERDRDRYGRTVAVCYVGGEDLDGWMVEQGWVVAFRKYSLDRGHIENDAKGQTRYLARRIRAVGLASDTSQTLTRRVGVGAMADGVAAEAKVGARCRRRSLRGWPQARTDYYADRVVPRRPKSYPNEAEDVAGRDRLTRIAPPGSLRRNVLAPRQIAGGESGHRLRALGVGLPVDRHRGMVWRGMASSSWFFFCRPET